MTSRMTNKRIVEELFPVLERAVRETRWISFNRRDEYGHPYFYRRRGSKEIRWTRYEGDGVTFVEVTMAISGKYDRATLLAAMVGREVVEHMLIKENKRGESYYGILDENKNVISLSKFLERWENASMGVSTEG
ncbi:MAG: hypothetical protein ACXQTS_00990 [Candidatus Methanospirareceae archaeon]